VAVDVTLELEVVLSDTAGVRLELKLEEGVADILVLSDTAVVGEPLVLELEEPVADTAVVGEPLELEEVVALSDTAVVTLGLDEIVGDTLELELVVREADGELVIAGPAPTATNAIFVD
jgi:hypothetical protein